jgi:hypothetical protein
MIGRAAGKSSPARSAGEDSSKSGPHAAPEVILFMGRKPEEIPKKPFSTFMLLVTED